MLEPRDGALAPKGGQPTLERSAAASRDPAPTVLEPAAASGPGLETAPAPRVSPVPSSPFPLVVVNWLDAWYDADEQTPEDWRNDYPVETVGYLVRDELTVISIAQEVLPDGEGFRAVTHIPRGMVQRIDRLVREDQAGWSAGALPQGA